MKAQAKPAEVASKVDLTWAAESNALNDSSSKTFRPTCLGYAARR